MSENLNTLEIETISVDSGCADNNGLATISDLRQGLDDSAHTDDVESVSADSSVHTDIDSSSTHTDSEATREKRAPKKGHAFCKVHQVAKEMTIVERPSPKPEYRCEAITTGNYYVQLLDGSVTNLFGCTNYTLLYGLKYCRLHQDPTTLACYDAAVLAVTANGGSVKDAESIKSVMYALNGNKVSYVEKSASSTPVFAASLAPGATPRFGQPTRGNAQRGGTRGRGAPRSSTTYVPRGGM
jgi:hypothetical protein